MRDYLGNKPTASMPKEHRSPVNEIADDLKVIESNAILFVWVDEIYDDYEDESGIYIARTLNKNKNRWGQVIAIGPNSEINIGEYILPDPNWSNSDPRLSPFGATHKGWEVWKCYDDNVLIVSNNLKDTEN